MNKPLLLLLCDKAVNQRAITTLLKNSKFEIVCTTNVNDTIAQIPENQPSFVLIYNTQGRIIANYLHEKFPQLKIGLVANRGIKSKSHLNLSLIETSQLWQLPIILDSVLKQSCAEMEKTSSHLEPEVIEIRPILERSYIPLSKTEQKILEMLSFALDTEEIASNLQISQGVVYNYITTIKRKFSVNNRAQAVAIGFRLGLVN